jgi:hypothetical protein
MTERELLAIAEAADALPVIEIRECLIAAGLDDAAEAISRLCDALFPYTMAKAVREEG